MLKKLVLAFLLVFLFLNVSGDISVLSPVEKVAENNSVLTIGEMQPGETLELLIDRDAGNFEWNSLTVENESSFPQLDFSVEKTFQTISLFITVPKTFSQDVFNFKIVLLSEPFEESFNARLSVKENLLSSSLLEKSTSSVIGQKTKYDLRIVNSSSASHKIRVSSSLPVYWFEPFETELKGKEEKSFELEVVPVVHGLRAFDFFVDSQTINERMAVLNADVKVYPTLRGKLITAFNGFPIFSPSLLPHYLINSFITYLT